MARQQDSADRRIEWAILVLGLAGIVAIFVPFALEQSPWRGMLWFVNPLVDWSAQYSADSWIGSAATTSLVLVVFFAPVITLVQLSRCVARRVSAVERATMVLALILVITGCVGWLGCMVFWTATEWVLGARYVVASIIATLIPNALFITARNASLRRKGVRAEVCVLVAYIGVAVFFAVNFWRHLDMTASVDGFTCVVYAVSVWRRTHA